jgi:hypothetical protein
MVATASQVGDGRRVRRHDRQPVRRADRDRRDLSRVEGQPCVEQRRDGQGGDEGEQQGMPVALLRQVLGCQRAVGAGAVLNRHRHAPAGAEALGIEPHSDVR